MKLNFNFQSGLASITQKSLLVSAIMVCGTLAQAQTSYTWDGSEGDNSWSNAANWTPVRTTPAAGDVLVINGTRTINLDFAAPSEDVDKIDIAANSNVVFRVESNKTINLGTGTGAAPNLFVRQYAKLTVTNSATNAALVINVPASSPVTKFARIDGTVEFNAQFGQAAHQLTGGSLNSVRFLTGSTFIAGAGFAGHPFGTGLAASAQFRNGTEYINQSGDSPFGNGSAVTVFDAGNTYTHQNPNPIDFNNRTYGNLVIDYPGYSATSLGSGASSVQNLTVEQATSVVFAHEGITNIRGNVAVNSGTLTIAPNAGTYNTFFRGTGLQSIATSGTGKMVFGNGCRAMIEAGNQVVLQSNITVRNQMQVYGLLDAQSFVVGSDVTTGSFTLISGGILYTSHPQGINKTGLLQGTVQVPGNRQFQTGTYRYYGGSAQQTGNGLPDIVNILTIENPEGVTLDKKVSVLNQLNLYSGVLHTTAVNLPTIDHLGVVSGYNSENYINGPLARIVNSVAPTLLAFPVGKGNVYRPISLTLTQNTSAATTYIAEYKHQAPPAYNLPTDLKRVSAVRYFTITSTSPDGLANGYITMPFTNDEGFGVQHPEGVRIAKSDGNGNWVNLGGAVDPDTETIENANSFTKFSDFALAFTSTTLPVSLISLDAAAKGNNVLVNWSTSKEENNAYFEVQRSADGVSYQTIGKVEGMGNSANRNDYAFTDFQPISGLAYYRLRQVDFDGKANFHGPVAVRRASNTIAQLALYPNPVVQSATLSFEAETDQTATLRIVNAIGQTVLQQQVAATKGHNAVTVPANQLQTGMYVVEMVTESGVSAARLIKQ